MSARIPPGYAEIANGMNILGDVETMYCTIGVKLASGVPVDQTVADALILAFRTAFNGQLSTEITFTNGYVIAGADGGDLRFDETNAPATGGVAAGPVPNNTSVLVQKTSGLGGRRNRGRFYMPGLPEGVVGGSGGIAAGTLTALNTAANGYRLGLTGLASVDEVVLFHSSAPFLPTVVTDLNVDSRVATQRRRLRP